MAATSKPSTVERRIHFFRADAGSKNNKPIALNLEPSLEALSKVPFAEDSKRYWQRDRRSEPVAAWLESQAGTLHLDRLAFAGIRRTALPMVEQDGALTDIPLAARQGLYEGTHVRFFGDNIVGVEFNFYAPRVSSLSAYLQQAVPSSPQFTLEPLLRNDVLEQLDGLKELRVLDLQVRRSYAADLVSASKSIGGAMKALADATRAEVIGITLRPEKNQRTELTPKVVNFSRSVLKKSKLRENALRFHVKGLSESTGQIDEIDLLQDQLVSEESILTVGKKSRAVESSSAYEAIGRAYESLRSELELAAGITLRSSS